MIPEAKTRWGFRASLKPARGKEKRLARCEDDRTGLGYRAQKGTVLDARIGEGPRPGPSREANPTIPDGRIPAQGVAPPAQRAQKDTEARGTRQQGQNHSGYQNPIARP